MKQRSLKPIQMSQTNLVKTERTLHSNNFTTLSKFPAINTFQEEKYNFAKN